jgi:hypothetical protein
VNSFRPPSASIDLRHATEESFCARGCRSAAAGPEPGDPFSSRGLKPEEQRPQHRELHQEGFFNEDEWYEDFHHGNFVFDDASPLSAEL